MENLPTKASSASALSLQERADHREWIGGRTITLLSHYWRDDDPVELTGAIGQDWADVLEGLPQEYIQRACIKYQRDEPRRKPTPGAIYGLAKAMMPKPRRVYDERVKATPEQDAAYQESVRRDVINEEKAKRAQEIIAKAWPSKRGEAT